METNLTEVYQRFLSKIKSDSYLAGLDEEDLEDELFNLLESAVPLILFPKTSLTMDIANKKFYVPLPAVLVDLVAEAMVTEWLGRQINDLELIELKYSTKDFQLTSQANQIKSLRESHLDATNKFRRKLDNYQRQDEQGSSVFRKALTASA